MMKNPYFFIRYETCKYNSTTYQLNSIHSRVGVDFYTWLSSVENFSNLNRFNWIGKTFSPQTMQPTTPTHIVFLFFFEVVGCESIL